MDVRLYWVKNKTFQGNFFIYYGPAKTNKADYFTKHHPPSYHTATRHWYPYKANHSIRFIDPQRFINNGLGLTSPRISHYPEGQKYNYQEPGGLASDCIMLIPKKTCPKSRSQEPVGSTSDCITLVLNKIRPVRTQNKIATPLMNNTRKTDTTEKCNSLHRKYLDITKNMWTSERHTELLVNSNMTIIDVLIWFHYQYYYWIIIQL